MNSSHSQFYLLAVALFGILALVFFIFRPFLYTLVLAAVFAVVFQPVYQRMLGFAQGYRGLASLLTLFVVIACIFAPLIFLGIQIFQEVQQLYLSIVENGGKDAILNVVNTALGHIKKEFPVLQPFPVDVDQYLKQVVEWLFQHLGAIFSGIAKLIVNAFIFLVALYYLLKDGQKLKAAIVARGPLSGAGCEAVCQNLERTINSVIKGSLAIALIQGTLVSVGFLIFGVPNVILWGSVAAVAALIPGIGTALVLVPAIVFLVLTSELIAALGLLVWGIAVVGLIDNFLLPKLVGRGAQLHPLVVLLAVLGGIGFFGPIGFLLGPLAMSLFLVLLELSFNSQQPG